MNSAYKRSIHTPVLLHELLEYLQPKPNKNYIDATINGGGMAYEVLKRNGPNGKLLGIDLDEEAITHSKIRLKEFKTKIVLQKNNFTNIKQIQNDYFNYPIDGIYGDLGISNNQLKDYRRGFSFQYQKALLDMRFGWGHPAFTAGQLLNIAERKELYSIFKNYGEEPRAKKISEEIIKKRREKPFEVINDLLEVIDRVYGKQRKRIHPATKVFQALRIAVNNELENLKTFLPNAFSILIPKGRLVVISFHSLEDRIVKKFFKELILNNKARTLSKKVVTPFYDEIRVNPHSRSAKLRAIEKI